MRNRSIAVLKFGGSSVGSVDGLRSVIAIAAKAAREGRIAVVASAASGVTDDLVRATGPEAPPVVEVLASIFDRHHTLARQLLGRDRLADYDDHLSLRLTALRVNLETAAREGTSPSLYDAIISEGERLMAPLVALCLSEAGVSADWIDAARIIRTDTRHADAEVDLDVTTALVSALMAEWPEHVTPVVTGFIGSTADGAVTTLGRSGSDYTAAVLSAALNAERVERWTDTDGLYTDDPRSNPDAKRIACIVLETALSWTQAGKLGMHRKTLDPLIEAGIPVYVRCTHQPEDDGTVILPSSHHHLSRREAV